MKDYSYSQRQMPVPSHIHNYSSFETCFDMNDSAKPGHCQLVPNGTMALEETWLTTEANNDWANTILSHLIQVRKVLFSQEAGKLVLSLYRFFFLKFLNY